MACDHGEVSSSFRSPFNSPEAAGKGAKSRRANPKPQKDNIVDDESGEWLAYELHEWASESRSMLAQLLVAEEVVHSWQGTTLLAHGSLEEQVDTLIEEVQVAEDPELDPEKPQTAFEMQGWSGELQAKLVERLGSASIPHEFDSDGDLVIHEADEDHVEQILDELLALTADEGLEELEGLELNDLLSAMFDAADRLRRDAHDGPAVLRCVEHATRLTKVGTPFGFAATNWAQIRERCATLVEMIQSDETPDEDLVTTAGEIRDALQRVI